MNTSRRNFLKTTAVAGAGTLLAGYRVDAEPQNGTVKKPIVISTWKHGMEANKTAMEILKKDSSALDAVEAGVRTAEDNPKISSVGYGGWPDANGIVTLDASIMNSEGDAGSVAFLQNIKNPVSVARVVMEQTPHVMIVGQGALDLALEHGFKEENLLTEKAKEAWLNWKKKNGVYSIENHDTIGQLAIDNDGNISGAVTTSGLAFKKHGRVGDSPIIGAALYVDNEIGAACATGMGEWVIKTVGSFLIVEKMREGFSPQEACEFAVKRLVSANKNNEKFQVGYIALNKSGSTGAYALRKGFNYALSYYGGNNLIDSEYLLKK